MLPLLVALLALAPPTEAPEASPVCANVPQTWHACVDVAQAAAEPDAMARCLLDPGAEPQRCAPVEGDAPAPDAPGCRVDAGRAALPCGG